MLQLFEVFILNFDTILKIYNILFHFIYFVCFERLTTLSSCYYNAFYTLSFSLSVDFYILFACMLLELIDLFGFAFNWLCTPETVCEMIFGVFFSFMLGYILRKVLTLDIIISNLWLFLFN